MTIIPNMINQATDIQVSGVPFVLNPSPGTGVQATNPPTLTFTVADAIGQIDPNSITLDITQDGVPGQLSVPVTLTACDDATATPCSPGGTLQGHGISRPSATPQVLQLGTAHVRIRAHDTSRRATTGGLRRTTSP